MCPIFCSFPNFGLIRKIPLSLVAQLVSFTEKNVDPPSGLGKNYDKQLCTQILGVEFPFNPMSWQYSWKAWKVPYNLLNCPILGLFSFSPTCFQCRMLLPILLTSHSVWKYLKKVAFFNIQHFCWDVFFSVNCNCHATYFIDCIYLGIFCDKTFLDYFSNTVTSIHSLLSMNFCITKIASYMNDTECQSFTRFSKALEIHQLSIPSYDS